MRHYDRADVRHLDAIQRYRDYDYLGEDDLPPTPQLSMVEPPPPAAVRALEGPPMWRLVLAALLHPRRSVRRALGWSPVISAS